MGTKREYYQLAMFSGANPLAGKNCAGILLHWVVGKDWGACPWICHRRLQGIKAVEIEFMVDIILPAPWLEI